MAKVKAKAFLLSRQEFQELKDKFPAYACPYVSERAKNEGAKVWKESYKGQGCFFLRTTQTRMESLDPTEPVYHIPKTVFVVNGGADCNMWGFTNMNETGLKFSIFLQYKEDSAVVKNVRECAKTGEVRIGGNVIQVTSIAPVVEFAGIEYVWTNKEDCENGKTGVMHLTTVEMVAKAEEFAQHGNHNNFAKATVLRKQCEDVAFENANSSITVTPSGISREISFLP